MIARAIPSGIHCANCDQGGRNHGEIRCRLKVDGLLLGFWNCARSCAFWDQDGSTVGSKRECQRHSSCYRGQQADSGSVEECVKIPVWHLIEALQRYLHQPCENAMKHRAGIRFEVPISFPLRNKPRSQFAQLLENLIVVPLVEDGRGNCPHRPPLSM